MLLQPWYKVETPREDLRRGEPLDASANTSDRVDGSGGLGIASLRNAFQPCGGVGSP